MLTDASKKRVGNQVRITARQDGIPDFISAALITSCIEDGIYQMVWIGDDCTNENITAHLRSTYAIDEFTAAVIEKAIAEDRAEHPVPDEILTAARRAAFDEFAQRFGDMLDEGIALGMIQERDVESGECYPIDSAEQYELYARTELSRARVRRVSAALNEWVDGYRASKKAEKRAQKAAKKASERRA